MGKVRRKKSTRKLSYHFLASYSFPAMYSHHVIDYKNQPASLFCRLLVQSLPLHLQSLPIVPMYPKLSHFREAPILIPYINAIIISLTHTQTIFWLSLSWSPPCFQPQRVKTGLPPQTRHFPPPNSHPCLGQATRGNTCRDMPRPKIMSRGRRKGEDTHWRYYQPGC